jgi:hypothetical protein
MAVTPGTIPDAGAQSVEQRTPPTNKSGGIDDLLYGAVPLVCLIHRPSKFDSWQQDKQRLE